MGFKQGRLVVLHRDLQQIATAILIFHYAVLQQTAELDYTAGEQGEADLGIRHTLQWQLLHVPLPPAIIPQM